MRPNQDHVQFTEENRPKGRAPGDLMFKDVLFVYPVTMVQPALGGTTESWALTPIPISGSVQVQALNSQSTDPDTAPNRYAHVYTRTRHGLKWHDKVIFRRISMIVERVDDKFDNMSGEFQYAEATVRLLSEAESIKGAQASHRRGI